MGGQQGAGGGEDKNSYGLLWGIAGIFVVGAIVWHFYGTQLKIGYMKVKYWELSAVSFFVDDEEVDAWRDGVKQAFQENTVKRATMYEASQVARLSGEYLRYPISIILGFLAWFLFRGHATMRFNKQYDMHSLARQEKVNWPQISPVVELDLIKEDINEGAWAMAMNPMQFAKHYKLLKIEIVANKRASWKSEGEIQATVIKEKATQVFSAQMGPLWTGVNALAPHTKAIYAALLLRAEHKVDEAREFLGGLSRSAAKGTIDYSQVDEIIKKHEKCKAALKCQQLHAYVLTIMASMLVIARSDGVLASCDFLWLKPLDRKLWFLLNCVGRQVAVSEVGGPFAHWLAEKHMGRPLSVPMVEQATLALEKAIEGMIYIPDENEELAKPQQLN